MGTKLYILGKQLVDYADRKTGEQIKGYKVFFFCEGVDNVDGHYADSVWIDFNRSPDLFEQISKLSIGDNFIEAEFVYSVIPGRRSQQLVSIHIAA